MQPLAFARFHLDAANQRYVHMIVPPHDTRYEDVLKPEFWAHVATHMRINNRIEVIAEDGSYFAELLIQDVGRNWAKVAPLRHVEIAQATKTDVSPDYEVKWRGPHHKFGVIRLNDSSVVREDFPTKEEANKWLADYVKAIAA